jgi:hypothetical protein
MMLERPRHGKGIASAVFEMLGPPLGMKQVGPDAMPVTTAGGPTSNRGLVVPRQTSHHGGYYPSWRTQPGIDFPRIMEKRRRHHGAICFRTQHLVDSRCDTDGMSTIRT